jgi:autotransporter-associated beta strand protein
MTWSNPLTRLLSPYRNRKARRAKLRPTYLAARPRVEALEARDLFAATLATVGTWTPQGPGPIQFGVVEGMQAQNNPVAGSVDAVAVAPDGKTAFIGASGGGVWRTTDVTAASPTWTPLTDQMPSLSISDVDVNPANPNLVVAGTGSRNGDDPAGAVGLYVSTDGGTNWVQSGGREFAGAPIVSIAFSHEAVRGTSAAQFVAVATSAGRDAGTGFKTAGGLFESRDGGLTWSKTQDVTGVLPFTSPSDLIEVSGYLDTVASPDVQHPHVFFAAYPGVGVFQSTDFATWTPVGSVGMNLSDNRLIRLAAERTRFPNLVSEMDLYAGLVNSHGDLTGIYLNHANGTNWLDHGVPQTHEDLLGADGQPGSDGVPDTFVGLHAFGRGLTSFSMMVDPRNPIFLYVGGDTQPVSGSFFVDPAAGTREFSGRLFRHGVGWEPIVGTNAGFTSPHSDSHDLLFVRVPDGTGYILEADAGGIYKLSDPGTDAALSGIEWTSRNGNLQIANLTSVGYDHVNNVYFASTASDGLADQAVPNSPGSPWQFAVTGTFDNNPFQSDRLNSGFGDSVVFTVDSVTNRAVRLSVGVDLTDGYRRDFNSSGQQVDISATFLDVTDEIAEPLFRSGLSFADSDDSATFHHPMELNAADPSRIAVAGHDLYESSNYGRTLTQIEDPTNLLSRGHFTALAAGTPTQPQVLYAAYGNLVGVRDAGPSALGAPLDRVFRVDGEGDILDIVIDPQNSRTAYLVTARNVFKVLDGGLGTASPRFVSLTGNLPRLGGDFHTIELVVTGAGPVLMVGGAGGVFLTSGVNDAVPKWEEIGLGLPNTVVTDLHFNATDNLLFAATDGRGVWQIANPDFLGNRGILSVTGTGGADSFTISMSADGTRIRVTGSDGTNSLFPLANVGEIRVDLGAAGDTLTLDGTNGIPGRQSRSTASFLTVTDTGTSGTDVLALAAIGKNVSIEKTGNNYRFLAADGTTTTITTTNVETLPAAAPKPLAILGHGIEQVLRDTATVRVAPHVSAEMSGLGLLGALDGTSSLMRRIFDQAGVRFDQLGTTVADADALEQVLQAASSFGAAGASVDDTNGLVVNFKTQVPVSGRGRLRAGQDQGLANVDLVADVTADVLLDIQFGVDSTGRFFVGTNKAAGAEITISNLRGTVSGDARLGFLGVTVKNGTISSDPTAKFEINLFDSGTVAVDNKLMLDEFAQWTSANVNAVLLPGTDPAVPNLSIAATIDVSLFNFSVFDDAQVSFTWNDFNTPAAFTVTPTLGANSPAQQLIDFITVNAGEVVSAIENLAAGLEGATGTQVLDTEIPVLGKTIGEVLNAVAQPLDLPAASVVATAVDAAAGTFRVEVENFDLGAAGVAVGRTVNYLVGAAEKQGVIEAVEGSAFTVRPAVAGTFPAATATTYRVLRPGTIAEQFNGFFENLNFTVPTLQELIHDLGAKLGIDLLSKVTVEGTGVNRFIKVPLDFTPAPLTFSQDLDFHGSIPFLDLQANGGFTLTVAPKFHVALGIGLAANTPVAQRFFVVKDDANELQLDVSATVTPTATGRVGFLDVTLGPAEGRTGIVQLAGSFGVNVVDPASPTDTRITLAELVSNGLAPFSATASGKLDVDGLAVKAGITNAGDLGQISISLNGADPAQGKFDDPADLAALPTRLLAGIQGEENFLKFDNITGLDVAAALIELIQELGTLSKAPAFNNPLPLINKSPAELLTLAESLVANLGTPESLDTSDAASTFDSANKVKLFLEGKLGTPVGLAVDSQSVRFTFAFDKQQSKTLPLGFSLGTDRSFANVSASGDLTATAKAGMTVTLGVTTSKTDAAGNPIALADRVFLDTDGTDGTPATSFAATVRVNSGYAVDGVTPDALQFDAALGPVGVGVVNGRVLVRGDFKGDLHDLPGSTDGKLTLGEISKALSANQLNALFGTTVTGDVQAVLPLDGNNDKSVTIPPGSADGLVRIAGQIQNFANPIDFNTTIVAPSQASLPIDPANLNANSVLINTTNLNGLITNGLLSFGNLVEGFEDLVEWGQKLLGINILDVKLPLVNRSIRDGLNFFEGNTGSLGTVLASIRNTINSSAAPTTTAAITTLAGVIATNLKALPNVFALGDVDGSGSVGTNKEEFFRVNTSGGKVTGVTFFLRYMPTISTSPTFDLGLDFLPLSASGGVTATAKLDAFLGFGVDFTNGFFLKTDFKDVPLTAWTPATPEITAKVTVTANQDLTLRIGGLSFDADFNPNTGTVGGTVGIDLEGGADGRITASEFIQGITNPQQFLAPGGVKFSVGAHVDVPLKLSAGAELPSVEGRLFFDIGNGGEVTIAAGTKLAPTVALNALRLNAGSFIDRLAKPLLEKLEVFSPFAKVADAFTAPLPLLDRSIYEMLRERLVQNGNTGAVQALDFLVKIGDFIDNASTLAGSGGGLFIDFGDIPLIGGTSTGGTNGTTQPGVGQPSSVAGGSVAVANVADQNATGTAPGGTTPVAGIPGSGLPVIGPFLKDLGEIGITFPVLEIGNLIKLVTGQVVDLVFVDLPPLDIDLSFSSPNIPLFNFGIPYVADVNVTAGFTVALGLSVDLSAGFDTRGLNSPGKSFLNGFYIGDFAPVDGQITPSGTDIPEVVLTAGVGVDVNAVVRLLGLEAGSITGHGSISGVLTVDLNDDNENNYPENPNDHAVPATDTRPPQERKDGKLYLDEIGIIRESRGGKTLALFDIDGKILAELGITLRALGGLFEKSYDFAFTVYEFENILRPEPPPSGTPDLASVGPRLINNVARQSLVLSRSSNSDSNARNNFAASNSEGGDRVEVQLVDKNGNPNDGYAIATVQPGTYTSSTTSITTLVPVPGTNPVQVHSRTIRKTTVTQPGADFANQGVKVGQRVSYHTLIASLQTGSDEEFATVTVVNGDSFTFEDGTLSLDTSKAITVVSGRETIRVKKGTTIEDFGPGEAGGNLVTDINSIQAIIVDGGNGTVGSFGAGDDELYIDPFFRGTASIQGGAGNDILVGGSGADTLDGGDGDDRLIGGIGSDTLIGGRGDDEITGGDGDDRLIGDRSVGGTNVAADGEGRDVISGGAGNDRIFGDNTVRSTGTNAGATAHDLLAGDEGNDTITAGEGNDTVFGNEGNDLLEGEDGQDALSGNDGNDTIRSGSGSDEIRGGLGNDQLFTGDTNVNDRNGGIDRVRGNEETGNFNIVFSPSVGIDDDFVNGLDSDFFYYYGGDGHDTVLGSARSDLIFGGAGGSDIIGGGGFDRIVGSSKNDRIVADVGRIDGLFLATDYLASLPPLGTGGDRVIGSGGTDLIQNFSGDIIGNTLSNSSTGSTPGTLDLGGASAGLNFNLDATTSQGVQFNGVAGTIASGGFIDNVIGSALADNFTVQVAARPRTIDGGSQPAGLRDSVTVNALGAAVTIRGNQVQAAGFGLVALDNVETFSLVNTSGTVTVLGTAGDDTLRLFAVGSTFHYELDGVEVNLGAISKFTFSAGGGNDHLILDFVGGNPIPAGGLTFSGANHGDTTETLELRGTNLETGEQTIDDTTPTTGTVTVGGRTVNYSSLTDVVVGSFAKHTLAIDTDFGPVRVVPNTDRGGTGETTIASEFTVAGVTTTVNHVTLSKVPTAVLEVGDDTGRFLANSSPADVLVTANAIPVSLTSFTLRTGGGADTLTVEPGAGTFTWDGGTGTDRFVATGDVNFTLRDDRVTAGGAAAVNLAGVETFALTGGASANTFALTTFGGDATLNGLGGTDSVSINLTGGRVVAVDPLTLSGNITTNAAATPARVEGSYVVSTTRGVSVADGTAADDLILDAQITGSGSLNFSGAGNRVLSGTPGYTGTTTVSAGTLTLDASLGSSAVSQTGGTFAGNGAADGLTSTGGTIQPGTATSPGGFSLSGPLVASAATTFAFGLHGTSPGRTYDSIGVRGTVNLGGAAMTTTLSGFSSAVGSQYTIIDNDGTDLVTGTFAGRAEGSTFAIGFNTFRINYRGGTGNDVVLTHVNTASAFAQRRITPGVAGGVVELIGVPVDADQLDDFTLSVNWGDGTAAESFTFAPQTPEVRLTHRYDRHGNYDVALQWLDPHGGGRSDTLVAEIARPETGLQSATYASPLVPGNSAITVRNRDGSERFQLPAFDSNYAGLVAVETGDVTGDGIDDVVVAAGDGGGPRVQVVDGFTRAPVADFFAYEAGFRGGVFVALGNLDDDPALELVTGTGFGGGPRVRTFDLDAGRVVPRVGPGRDFFAYDADFRGGVYVDVADLDGDGVGEIVTGTGPGGGPHVRVVGADGSLLGQFLAFDPEYRGGVSVGAAGDTLAVGTGAGPLVKLYRGANLAELRTLVVGSPDYRGGVRVALADVVGDADLDLIVTAEGGATEFFSLNGERRVPPSA